MLLDPGEHLGPTLLGLFGAIARPVIGVEAVRRVRIDLALAGFAGRLARRLPLLVNFRRNELIGAAVEREHRTFQIRLDIGRVLRRQLAGWAVDSVPRDSRFEVGVVRGIEPDGAPAPTEPGDRELGSVRLARGFRESDSRIEVRIDLRVRHLGDDFPHYLLAIAHLRGIALRAYSSGAIAKYPDLARRRQRSLMCSWTPKISCTTSTVG